MCGKRFAYELMELLKFWKRIEIQQMNQSIGGLFFNFT